MSRCGKHDVLCPPYLLRLCDNPISSLFDRFLSPFEGTRELSEFGSFNCCDRMKRLCDRRCFLLRDIRFCAMQPPLVVREIGSAGEEKFELGISRSFRHHHLLEIGSVANHKISELVNNLPHRRVCWRRARHNESLPRSIGGFRDRRKVEIDINKTSNVRRRITHPRGSGCCGLVPPSALTL